MPPLRASPTFARFSLHASGLSTRKIATSPGVGQSTASEYVKRIKRAGLTWPLAAEMTDAALDALLFQPIGSTRRLVEAQPDWPAIHRELKRPGVTLSLLWEEYRAIHPEGYGYSRLSQLTSARISDASICTTSPLAIPAATQLRTVRSKTRRNRSAPQRWRIRVNEE